MAYSLTTQVTRPAARPAASVTTHVRIMGRVVDADDEGVSAGCVIGLSSDLVLSWLWNTMISVGMESSALSRLQFASDADRVTAQFEVQRSNPRFRYVAADAD